MHSLVEVGQEAETVRSEIEQLFVRGLAASTPAQRKNLAVLAEEWERLGAGHVSSRLLAALHKADKDAKDAPAALLSAYTSLHVFERVISLEAAAASWSAHIDALREEEEGDEDEDDPAAKAATTKAAAPPPATAQAASPPAPAAPPLEDPKGALALAQELSRAAEDLVRTGLASASEGTRAKLDASFKEASRRKLLRLGASLRFVNDEVARFLADDGSFAMRRFSFFLHRSWLLARGLAKGLETKDERLLGSLLSSASAAPRPVASVEVVTMGALKRTIVSQNSSSFDFKLRVVGGKDPSLIGRSLTYSMVFLRKKGVSFQQLPAEAHLHLPQAQKFAPTVFRNGKVITITDCAVSLDDRGAGRLHLGPKSTVKEGAAFSAWGPLWRFDPAGALDRIQRFSPGPLDLAVELQEEVIVSGATIGAEPIRTNAERRVFALTGEGGLSLDLVIPEGPDGEELLPRLRKGLKPAKKPLLYGLAYYELGRTLFLPLSLLEKAGPDLVTLSERKFDLAQLVGTLHI